MSWVAFANYINIPPPANGLAFRTNFFYRRFYFHSRTAFLKSLNNSSLTTIWLDFKNNLVAYKHTNSMKSHFPREVREHFVFFVVKLHFKQRVWQCFRDHPGLAFQRFFVVLHQFKAMESILTDRCIRVNTYGSRAFIVIFSGLFGRERLQKGLMTISAFSIELNSGKMLLISLRFVPASLSFRLFPSLFVPRISHTKSRFPLKEKVTVEPPFRSKVFLLLNTTPSCSR